MKIAYDQLFDQQQPLLQTKPGETLEQISTHPCLFCSTSSTVIPKMKMFSSPTSSFISTFAPSRVPMVRPPFNWKRLNGQKRITSIGIKQLALIQMTDHHKIMKIFVNLYQIIHDVIKCLSILG